MMADMPVSDDSRFNHRQILRLAVPMIIANISTPLLGLVDTAVMGHLDSPRFLGGVALGGLIFGFIYWGFGFLRMGTTGLTAQALGNQDGSESRCILARAMLAALLIAAMILLLQRPVSAISFWLIGSDPVTEGLAQEYFNVRIWSAPATLGNYVLLDWFLGMQKVNYSLLMVVLGNLTNILLDLLFVVHLQMTVEGVALASVLAEFLAFLTGLGLLRRLLRGQPGRLHARQVLDLAGLRKLLAINNDIFLRTLCLIFAFAFFTAQSAIHGELVLAANTVLLNFQMFMAFALDGFAHAAEAEVGRAVGAGDKKLFRRTVLTAVLWSSVVAGCFALFYGLFGVAVVQMLTDLDPVRRIAYDYLPWVVVLPIVSVWCFLLDGIFVGATLTREMRNTMLFATLICFLPAWYFSMPLGNHGLWLAMTVFFLARGVSMGVVFGRRWRKICC